MENGQMTPLQDNGTTDWDLVRKQTDRSLPPLEKDGTLLTDKFLIHKEG